MNKEYEVPNGTGMVAGATQGANGVPVQEKGSEGERPTSELPDDDIQEDGYGLGGRG